ncbi:unnamed protein product [Mucor hiemalis]
MNSYKHLKSKDSFFSEHPLSEWDLPNYINYYEEKHSQKSKKALKSTFLCHLKSITRDPSISEESKDSVNNIFKESENKDGNQEESSNCIKINGNVISSNISLVALSSNSTVERQTIEKAIEGRQKLSFTTLSLEVPLPRVGGDSDCLLVDFLNYPFLKMILKMFIRLVWTGLAHVVTCLL